MGKRIPNMRVPVRKGHLVMLLWLVHLMMRHRMVLLLLSMMLLLLLHLHMLQHRGRHRWRRRRNSRIPKLNTSILVLHIHPISSSILLLLTDNRPNTELIPILLFLLSTNHKRLHLATNHHPKSLPSPRFFHPRHTRSIAPFVDFSPQRIRFVFQDPQLPRGE